MWSEITDFAVSALASVPTSSEFWSGILGAVVGGGISYLVQLRALRETRDNRREDHLRVQQALGNALLFKIIRIHSNFHGIHQHFEGCFERAAINHFTGEPWQFVLPLANFPDPVHLSADEMGMLLGLKGNDVFNMIAPLDAVHNSLVEATKVMSAERRALAERMKPDEAKGNVLSGELDRESYLSLRPRMIEVNTLIESIKEEAKRDFAESLVAMNGLHALLKERLGLTYKIESTVAPQPTP